MKNNEIIKTINFNGGMLISNLWIISSFFIEGFGGLVCFAIGVFWLFSSCWIWEFKGEQEK